MRILVAITLILFLVAGNILGQEYRTFEISDFSFNTTKDQLSAEYSDDFDKTLYDIVKPTWEKSIYDQKENPRRQSRAYPIVKYSLAFAPTVVDRAFDLKTGSEVLFGSDTFSKLTQDSIICFNAFSDSRAVVVNLKTGKEIFSEVNQPWSKQPYFINSDYWLLTYKENGEALLASRSLRSGDNNWSMQFDDFEHLKTVIQNEIIYTADDQHLYAIDPLTGRVYWRLNIAVSLLEMDSDSNLLFVVSDKNIFIAEPGKLEPKLIAKIEDSEPVYDVYKEANNLYIQRSTSLSAFDLQDLAFVWKADWFFTFGKYDQISVMNDYIITISQETDRYNLVFNKSNGKLIAFDTENYGYKFAGGAKDCVIATNEFASKIFGFKLVK